MQKLSDDEKDFVDYLQSQLPPVLARHDLPKFLGGLISPYTIKNADLAGHGPEVAWRVGRKVAYKTESLLIWLVRSLGVQRIRDARSI